MFNLKQMKIEINEFRRSLEIIKLENNVAGIFTPINKNTNNEGNTFFVIFFPLLACNSFSMPGYRCMRCFFCSPSSSCAIHLSVQTQPKLFSTCRFEATSNKCNCGDFSFFLFFPVQTQSRLSLNLRNKKIA